MGRPLDDVGTTGGEVAKRSNATDCKSVAPRASKVRILSSPPFFWRGRESRQKDSHKAGVAQLVELQPSKLDVAASNPVARSTPVEGAGAKGRTKTPPT